MTFLGSSSSSLSGGARLPIEVNRGSGPSPAHLLIRRLPGRRDLSGHDRQSARGPVKSARSSAPSRHDPSAARAFGRRGSRQGDDGARSIAGPQVMRGYWKKPAETSAQFVGRSVGLGDVSASSMATASSTSSTHQGLYPLLDYSVYPARIEEAIYEHPAVDEGRLTVIGVRTIPRRGRKAFVKLKPDMTASPADILKATSSPVIAHRDAGRDRDARQAAENHDQQAVEEGAQGGRGQTASARASEAGGSAPTSCRRPARSEPPPLGREAGRRRTARERSRDHPAEGRRVLDQLAANSSRSTPITRDSDVGVGLLARLPQTRRGPCRPAR